AEQLDGAANPEATASCRVLAVAVTVEGPGLIRGRIGRNGLRVDAFFAEHVADQSLDQADQIGGNIAAVGVEEEGTSDSEQEPHPRDARRGAAAAVQLAEQLDADLVLESANLSGAAQAPKDIPDTVSQAGSAASKVLQLFSGELFHSPTIVKVDEEICKGCGLCVEICPYGARYIDPRTKKARIRDALCQGCGACAAACPSGASQLKNMTKPQLLDMIDAVL
ncbi:MAG: 4Fe-4S binding protein, partial [Firmicutes bacterium]|nr:4Fe-4S binding protein [Bacillota bacterium]